MKMKPIKPDKQTNIATVECECGEPDAHFHGGGDGSHAQSDKYHVHLRCFAAWEFERNKPST